MESDTYFLTPGRLQIDAVRREAARLQNDASYLRAMIDSSASILVVLNPQRQIVICNEACANAAGLPTPEEAVGKRLGEVLHCIHASAPPAGCGTTPHCQYCGAAKAISSGLRGQADTEECLLECSSEDGSERHMEFSVDVRPLPDLGEGWQTCSMTNISDEKRRRSLERIFFHDILNRAAGIQGLSTLLQEEVAQPDVNTEEMFRMLSESAKALVDEIKSQRLLLEAEQGVLDARFAPVSVDSLLNEAAVLCTTFGYCEGKHIRVTPGDGSIMLVTDRALLGRVLINLLKNALEASASGAEIIIRVTLNESDVVLEVHNDAVMAPEVSANVFKRSFSTKGAGRGLGTYSVKLLVENYLHGHVSFQTSAQGGTTFVVSLLRVV